jgi:hypothetical protein
MKKWIFTGVISFFLALFSTAWANTNTDFIAAKTTIENWFSAMKNGETTKAASYLSPNFVSIHTDGVVRNKTQEVTLIKNLHMKDYRLTNFKFTDSGNTVIVTYKDTGNEMIDKHPISAETAGRMAVLQKQKKGTKEEWLIIAYANLDEIS